MCSSQYIREAARRGSRFTCVPIFSAALSVIVRFASKRVHVERFIYLAKTYTILSSPLNTSETMLASEIIFIRFMLCSFSSGIVHKYA